MPPPWVCTWSRSARAYCETRAQRRSPHQALAAPWSAAANDVARTALVTGRMDDANT
ncbi:hypothetical protein XCR_3006 [Xanthomonas campestris pv. raphani 756C]|nr:hypothetical protein XCR_3006 [Xanthomonas campestris pv. raphani 756C]